MTGPRRVALVHEWLTSMRGGERVLEKLCRMFPDAHLYTLLHVRGSVSETIERRPVRTSFIQHLPFSSTAYRYYLPLFPSAIERFRLDEYDLVISSHHSVAKGVQTGRNTLHLCYCHTPMRYIWSLFDQYFAPERTGRLTRTGARLFRPWLQRYDQATAGNPAAYAANSEHVRERIRRLYGRDAEVIYPPVDVGSFPLTREAGAYLLAAGALVPYKRIDLVIEACRRTGDRLIVAGDGPELRRLKSLAGTGVEFRQAVSDEDLRDLYAGCRALVFPGEEDFGIMPVEAMACGKPVVAFGRGGALETVVDGETGLFFREPTIDSLADQLLRLRAMSFDPGKLRARAMNFDSALFEERMQRFVDRHWASRNTGRSPAGEQ